MSRRGVLVAVSLTLAVAVGAAIVLVRGAGGGEPPAPPSSTGSSLTVSTTGWGPQPPDRGVWVGAWVKPAAFTTDGRVSAIQAYEARLGRPLDVVQQFHKFTDDFPDAADQEIAKSGAILLLSWSGEDTQAIAAGKYDDLVRARALAIKALGVPVLLRWRWEMNRPNLQGSVHSPQDFVAAWKHLRGIFAAEQVTNAGWVWCPLAAKWTAQTPLYYPGDDQVDWLCADVYPGPQYRSFSDVAEPFLRWAAQHPRPIIIGEYGAQERAPGQRADWIRGVQSVVEGNPQIKALVYFDARSEGTPAYDLTLESGDAFDAYRAMVDSPAFAVRRKATP